jgi:hypothetical protein
MDIWTRTFEEVGRDYPDITRDHAYIDAACMWMVKNPESFDTVVVSNMFGDIFTDLKAAIQGGMGVAASGNIHPWPPKRSPADRRHPGRQMLRHVGEEPHASAVPWSRFSRRELRSTGTDSGVSTRLRKDGPGSDQGSGGVRPVGCTDYKPPEFLQHRTPRCSSARAVHMKSCT